MSADALIQAAISLDKVDQSKMTDDEKVGFKIVKRAPLNRQPTLCLPSRILPAAAG